MAMINAAVLFFHLVSGTENGTEKAYLGSDILWSHANHHHQVDNERWRYVRDFGGLRVNSDFGTSGKIDINGRTFERGIVAHANSILIFDIGRVWHSFHACIGISTSSSTNCAIRGGAKFRVLGDGAVLRDWDLKGFANSATCFTIDIVGVKLLLLEADRNGNKDCSFSTWADAWVSVTKLPTEQPSMLLTEKPSLATEHPECQQQTHELIVEHQKQTHELIAALSALGTVTVLMFCVLLYMCFGKKDSSLQTVPAVELQEKMHQDSPSIIDMETGGEK